MLTTPTRVYAFETADSLPDLEARSAARKAEGWERVDSPRVTQVRVTDGAVHMVYRQEYLKFVAAASRAGFVSCVS
jgi:hypothetical protein